MLRYVVYVIYEGIEIDYDAFSTLDAARAELDWLVQAYPDASVAIVDVWAGKTVHQALARQSLEA